MKIHSLILSALVLVVLHGCSNDEVEAPNESHKRLLAGDPGQSKSWKLINGIAYSGSDPDPIEMVFEDCFLDNLYTFTNSQAQPYTTTEGNSRCNDNDPAEIERGFWAFVENHEKLLISANDLIHLNQSLFGKFSSPPATVLLLNESEMELEFNYTETGVPDGTFRFRFEAAN